MLFKGTKNEGMLKYRDSYRDSITQTLFGVPFN